MSIELIEPQPVFNKNDVRLLRLGIEVLAGITDDSAILHRLHRIDRKIEKNWLL